MTQKIPPGHAFNVSYAMAVAWVCLFVIGGSEACGRGSIHLKNNGYRQILIAIGNNVTEDVSLLQRIQDVFTKASAYLYKVTRNRAYFAEIVVLIPQGWSNRLEYVPATNETMSVSDIVVDNVTPGYREAHKPFVVRSSPCGKYGEYMQLSPEYLKDENIANTYGLYEKVIVHEWAHLRYGVFDEYPDGGLDSPHFYAAGDGEIEGTRCSFELQGDFYDVLKKDSRCDFENGLPDANCRFEDEKDVTGKYGSLMYRHQLSHIDAFCDNDTNTANGLHNREAPTYQNRNCDGRSVWEVLRSHDDFKNGANPPRQVSSTVPTFRIVKYRTKRTVIVLDTSGSMSRNNKLGKLAQAVQNYLMNVAVDGEEIGMVWFSTRAFIKSDLTLINNQTRSQLVGQIPRRAMGATSIGGGLLKALAVLSRDGQDPAGGVILLVTDGKETTPPWVADIQDEILESQVIVDTIAITSNADNKIENLATKTSGLSFYYSDRSGSNALNEAFIAQSERGTDVTQRPVQLSSQSVMVGWNETFEDEILIDSTVGRKTEFLIGYSVNLVVVELITPSGGKLTHEDPECTMDTVFKLTRFTIRGIAERGRWRYRVLNPGMAEEPVTVTVTSGVVPGSLPIVATARWGTSTVTLPEDRQILYVTVSQGLFPVLQANVEATLERPDVDRAMTDPITLLVRDNGAGADITRDDGIYSSYVTDFTENGRYYVKVKVNNSPVSVSVRDRILGTGASGSPGRHSGGRDTRSAEKTDDFQRVTSAGSFRLRNFIAGFDIYPPSKITDLRVASADYEGKITLSWTATGADLDRGTAASYTLWKAKKFETLFNNHTEGDRVTVNQPPLAAGSAETYTLHVQEKGSVTHYFALEAVDIDGNTSPRSNIVSVSMKHLSPPLNIALVVGCCVAGLLLATLGVAAFFLYRRKQLKSEEQFDKRMAKEKEKTMKY